MAQLQKMLTYFFSAHFFIALIAVLLSLESSIVLHQPFQNAAVYVFIFSATHFAYNVYYVKTENARLFTSLSIIACLCTVASVFYIPQALFPKLGIISFASVWYILPIFYSFKKSWSFSLQKLLLLVFVWVGTTFILPVSIPDFQYETLLLLVYRIVVILLSCLLFFIRDEKDEELKRKAIAAVYVLCFLHLLLAFLVLFTVQISLGFLYLFTALLACFISFKFLSKNYAAVYYLAFVDGILFFQSFVVLIFYFLHPF